MAKKPKATDVHVGARVRLRRMMLGMSQEKLAGGLKLTFQQVQKYEKGANRIGASRLQEIARILQVQISFFFDGLDDETVGAQDKLLPEYVSPSIVAEFVASRDGMKIVKAFAGMSQKLRHGFADLALRVSEGHGDE